jgi:hypothetical protein
MSFDTQEPTHDAGALHLGRGWAPHDRQRLWPHEQRSVAVSCIGVGCTPRGPARPVVKRGCTRASFGRPAGTPVDRARGVVRATRFESVAFRFGHTSRTLAAAVSGKVILENSRSPQSKKCTEFAAKRLALWLLRARSIGRLHGGVLTPRTHVWLHRIRRRQVIQGEVAIA